MARPATASERAEWLLHRMISTGPAMLRDVKAQAAKHHISWRTMKRVARRLKLVTAKQGRLPIWIHPLMVHRVMVGPDAGIAKVLREGGSYQGPGFTFARADALTVQGEALSHTGARVPGPKPSEGAEK